MLVRAQSQKLAGKCIRFDKAEDLAEHSSGAVEGEGRGDAVDAAGGCQVTTNADVDLER